LGAVQYGGWLLPLSRGKDFEWDPVALGVFFVGIAAISIMLSVNFAKKDRE